jgi:hypothetical protein
MSRAMATVIALFFVQKSRFASAFHRNRERLVGFTVLT